MSERSRPAPEAHDVLSTRDLGRMNQSQILRALVSNGPLSRADLAARSGVSRASMGAIVGQLLSRGLIEELDAAPRRGAGKPARPLWFTHGAGAVGAISLEVDACRASVVDATGWSSEIHETPIDDAGSAASVTRSLTASVTELLGRSGPAIGAVGVAVPGVCDTASATVLESARMPGVVGAQLAATLARITDLPSLVDNDARSQARAELWFGEGRTVSSFVCLSTGQGVGVGIVVDGVVRAGPSGRAGEVGHSPLADPSHQCDCGRRGCWETITSTAWMRSRACTLGLVGHDDMTVEALTGLMATGDTAASVLLSELADNLGRGLAVICQTLEPELVIMHGESARGGEHLRSLVEVATTSHCDFPVPVRLTSLGEPALLGAAAGVLPEALASGAV